MLSIPQIRQLIIKPALTVIDGYTLAADELVLGTALQESRLQYIKHIENGPALGIFYMDPKTHEDIWNNFLKFRSDLAEKVMSLAAPTSAPHPSANELIGNLWYAAAMCRLHYMRVPSPLPKAGDIPGMASYWKEYYNTFEGSGTEEEFEENWFANMGSD